MSTQHEYLYLITINYLKYKFNYKKYKISCIQIYLKFKIQNIKTNFVFKYKISSLQETHVQILTMDLKMDFDRR